MSRTAEVVCTVCQVHAESWFRVEGMDCSEEVAILERRLKPIAGLEAVSADLMGQRLHVKYDAARLSTSVIVDAVADTGMRAWLEHEEPAPSAEATRSRQRLVAASGAALVAGMALQHLDAPAPLAIAAFLASVITAGIFPVRRAVVALRAHHFDINVLMVVAVLGAMALGDWAEAGTVVFLFAIAQWLEARTMDRARHAIRALMDLSPVEATVRDEGHEHRKKVDDVAIGEVMLVRPGEKVPLDGIIEAGETDVNQAPITGESLPIDKAPGDEVFAGTINGRGAIDVRVTRLRRDTTLARIIHLVERAQAQRAPAQALVDRFARYYTPAVIVLAAAIAAVPPLAFAQPFAEWIYRALVLLVIACPCALVISTPVSIVSALAAAARHGVLIKGGIHLERTGAVRCLAFDKTGTLTHGRPEVTAVHPFDGATEADVLTVAAALESRSAHPIAHAIVQRARDARLDPVRVDRMAALPGRGAEGVVAGAPAFVGNARLLEERGVMAPALRAVEAEEASRGRSLVFVVRGGRVLGAIAIADRPRPTAAATVELLRQHGVAHIVMLTGDGAATAQAIARELGIDDVRADLLPEDKVTAVEALRRRYGTVVMVGDGVNDAPALAAADVGVAMGAVGADAALETADIALMSDELQKIPYAVRLSRATVRNIRANVAISIVLKAAFLAMAVTGTASLWMAVLADTGASLIVVANGLRLLRTK